jgi:hypothetical protein
MAAVAHSQGRELSRFFLSPSASQPCFLRFSDRKTPFSILGARNTKKPHKDSKLVLYIRGLGDALDYCFCDDLAAMAAQQARNNFIKSITFDQVAGTLVLRTSAAVWK